MRVSEIIRQVLDVIDQVETGQPVQSVVVQNQNSKDQGDDIRRFKQIIDLQDQGEPTEYSNTPKEEYAGIDSVTTGAGGGVHSPKDPADIRGEHPSLYPGKVYGVR